MSVKVVAAINGMNKLGHDAHLYRHEGKVWVEIDHCMLASFEEVAELFKQRYAKEFGRP